MNTRFHITEPGDETPPDDLKPFVGLKVEGAWILPDGMFFCFEGDKVFQVTPTRAVGLSAAFVFKIGETKPGSNWHDILDRACGQGPHEIFVRGLPFLGMDRDVLMFGDATAPVGFQISMRGIRFVKGGGRQ